MRSSVESIQAASAAASALATTLADNDNRIKASLDAFVSRQSTQRQLTADLTAICDSDQDSTWEVLSYLDQYHRRHLLSMPVFQT